MCGPLALLCSGLHLGDGFAGAATAWLLRGQTRAGSFLAAECWSFFHISSSLFSPFFVFTVHALDSPKHDFHQGEIDEGHLLIIHTLEVQENFRGSGFGFALIDAVFSTLLCGLVFSFSSHISPLWALSVLGEFPKLLHVFLDSERPVSWWEMKLFGTS